MNRLVMKVTAAMMRRNQEKALVKNQIIDEIANADARTWAIE